MKVKYFFMTREDGVNLYRTYSDKGFYIRKVGTDDLLVDAIDVENANNEYEETDKPIEIREEI